MSITILMMEDVKRTLQLVSVGIDSSTGGYN